MFLFLAKKKGWTEFVHLRLTTVHNVRKLAKYLCTYAELPYSLSNNLFVFQSWDGHNHVMFGPLDV